MQASPKEEGENSIIGVVANPRYRDVADLQELYINQSDLDVEVEIYDGVDELKEGIESYGENIEGVVFPRKQGAQDQGKEMLEEYKEKLEQEDLHTIAAGVFSGLEPTQEAGSRQEWESLDEVEWYEVKPMTDSTQYETRIRDLMEATEKYRLEEALEPGEIPSPSEITAPEELPINQDWTESYPSEEDHWEQQEPQKAAT
jgi:hypothetical protein